MKLTHYFGSELYVNDKNRSKPRGILFSFHSIICKNWLKQVMSHSCYQSPIYKTDITETVRNQLFLQCQSMACYLPHPAPGVNRSQEKSFREPLKKKILLVTWDWELLRGVLPIQIARLLEKSRRVGNRRSLALPGPGIRNNILCS